MKLKYMISYRVHDPAMKLAEPEDFTNDAELVELRNKAMANNTELPEDLAILIPQGLRVLMHECNSLKVHPRMSVQGVSKDIIVLILNADVIICDDNLYVLFDEAEDFLNFQSTNACPLHPNILKPHISFSPFCMPALPQYHTLPWYQ